MTLMRRPPICIEPWVRNSSPIMKPISVWRA